MNTKCPKELLYSMLCNMQLRLRLFRLKTLSRNYFTPLYVFGSYGKYGQQKIIYALTGPFERKLQHTPEDRERARRESEEDNPTVTSFKPAHRSCFHQTHVTDFASATSRLNPPWPSCLHLAILPPPPLNRTQSPLFLPSPLNLTGFNEFFGLVWY